MAAAWQKFKNDMKAKRTKGGNRNSKPKDHGHGTAEQKILENGELTVQKLSSEVAGRTQKYTKLGAREFVRFPYTEVTIDHIKDACRTHFGAGRSLECDVLAGNMDHPV